MEEFNQSINQFNQSQTPDIQLCLLVQQTGTIIADDMYVCIELVCTATTYS